MAEIVAHFESVRPRGEFVIVIDAADQSAVGTVDLDAAAELATGLLREGLAPSRVAKNLARQLNMGRNQAYELVQRVSRAVREDE